MKSFYRGRSRLAKAMAAAMSTSCVLLTVGQALGQANQVPVVRQVADGKPWTMTMLTENRTMKLTLNADGTGKMEGGPMALSPTWRETAQGMCIKPMAIMPERCATLRREGATIVGVSDGEPQFRLQRP